MNRKLSSSFIVQISLLFSFLLHIPAFHLFDSSDDVLTLRFHLKFDETVYYASCSSVEQKTTKFEKPVLQFVLLPISEIHVPADTISEPDQEALVSSSVANANSYRPRGPPHA